MLSEKDEIKARKFAIKQAIKNMKGNVADVSIILDISEKFYVYIMSGKK